MARGLVVVMTVGLLALAGGAPAGVSTPQQSNVQTALSNPSLSTTPTETPNETTVLPPGTSESGIDNATRLLETHQSRLANETYSVRTTVDRVSETTENGTFLGFDVGQISLTVVKGTTKTLVTFEDENVTYDDANSSQSYWVTDEVTALKQFDDKGVETTMYTFFPRTGRFTDSVSGVATVWADPSFVMRPYLLGVDYEYAGTVTRDNRTLHRFRSTGLNTSAVDAHDITEFPSSVERVDVTLLVDERGVIRSFDASELRSRENQTVTTGVTYAIPNLGNVTPQTPNWVTSELPHLDASLSGNGTVVTINHTGGMVVTKADLLVYSSAIEVSGEFTGTFAPGETLYFYVLRDDTDRLLVSQNEHPEVNDSFVRLGGDNVSVTPWRLVIGGGERNRTTIEVEISENASNPTRTTTTEKSNDSSRPLWWQWSSHSSENEYSPDVIDTRIRTTATRITHDGFREP